MENYCAEYSGHPLRYGVEGDDLLINTADLCAILDIDERSPEVLNLSDAVHLAQDHDATVARWLLAVFDEFAPADLEGSLAWLHDQVRDRLRSE